MYYKNERSPASLKSFNRYQLIGAACLLIASKAEEITPPQLKDLAYLMDDQYEDDELKAKRILFVIHIRRP